MVLLHVLFEGLIHGSLLFAGYFGQPASYEGDLEAGKTDGRSAGQFGPPKLNSTEVTIPSLFSICSVLYKGRFSWQVKFRKKNFCYFPGKCAAGAYVGSSLLMGLSTSNIPRCGSRESNLHGLGPDNRKCSVFVNSITAAIKSRGHQSPGQVSFIFALEQPTELAVHARSLDNIVLWLRSLNPHTFSIMGAHGLA